MGEVVEFVRDIDFSGKGRRKKSSDGVDIKEVFVSV